MKPSVWVTRSVCLLSDRQIVACYTGRSCRVTAFDCPVCCTRILKRTQHCRWGRGLGRAGKGSTACNACINNSRIISFFVANYHDAFCNRMADTTWSSSFQWRGNGSGGRWERRWGGSDYCLLLREREHVLASSSSSFLNIFSLLITTLGPFSEELWHACVVDDEKWTRLEKINWKGLRLLSFS